MSTGFGSLTAGPARNHTSHVHRDKPDLGVMDSVATVWFGLVFWFSIGFFTVENAVININLSDKKRFI